MKLVIVNTGCANISSVKFAIERLGYEVTVSDDPAIISDADKLFLPGVGTAAAAMSSMNNKQLVELVCQLQQPVLGICLGMQLLTTFSEEGDVSCLGKIDASVKRMQVGDLRLPHMGWNQIQYPDGHPLFADIPQHSYFYFVHSFSVAVGEYTLATCDYGKAFSAAIGKGNMYGVQFHPERSGQVGAQLIKNFIERVQ